MSAGQRSNANAEYREYQRQQSLKVIAEIAAIKADDEDGDGSPGAGGGGGGSGGGGGKAGLPPPIAVIAPEHAQMLAGLEEKVRAFVTTVKRLQKAVEEKAKQDYVAIVEEGCATAMELVPPVRGCRPTAGDVIGH